MLFTKVNSNAKPSFKHTQKRRAQWPWNTGVCKTKTEDPKSEKLRPRNEDF